MQREDFRACMNKTCPGYMILLEVSSRPRKEKRRCSVCEEKLKLCDPFSEEFRDVPMAKDVEPLSSQRARFLLGTGEIIERTTGVTPVHVPPHLPSLGASQRSTPDAQEAATFESGCDVDGCPIAPKAIIEIPHKLYQTWVLLAQRFSVEWIAYLKGRIEEDGRIVLDADGMVFPEQLANGAHVEAAENSVPEGCVASVHSHVRMNAYFSKEDREHFNHPADLVVNAAGELECVVRTKLECGRWQRVKAAIRFTNADLSAFHALKGKLVIDNTPQGNVDVAFNRLSPSAVAAPRLNVLDKRSSTAASLAQQNWERSRWKGMD